MWLLLSLNVIGKVGALGAWGSSPVSALLLWVIPDLVLRALYQAGLGFLGGWYGGYLRRRQTQMSATDPRRRR